MKIIKIASVLGLSLLLVPAFFVFGNFIGDWMNEPVLNTLFIICIASILISFFVGEWTGNNSQVDKIWSILPIIYIWVIAYYGNFSPRLNVMAILVSIWGIRLTYNFSLKGAYQWKFWEGEEDYRWQILRKKKEFQPTWRWTLFNLLFICTYQNILILLFTLPGLIAYQYADTALGIFDYIVAGCMLTFIFMEAIADKQHWDFQSRKWKLIQRSQTLQGDYAKGFLDKGLWSWSRHPNYFFEQMIWIAFYFFSVSASGLWINWSMAGAILLILLFQGSARFSEEISSKKYPEYKKYQNSVSMFIPLPPKT